MMFLPFRELGFRGTWLIYGGVMLQMLVAGMLTKPMEPRRYRKKREDEETVSQECKDTAHVETKEFKEVTPEECKLDDNNMKVNRMEEGGIDKDVTTNENKSKDEMNNDEHENGEILKNEMHGNSKTKNSMEEEMEMEEQNGAVKNSPQTATKQVSEENT